MAMASSSRRRATSMPYRLTIWTSTKDAGGGAAKLRRCLVVGAWKMTQQTRKLYCSPGAHKYQLWSGIKCLDYRRCYPVSCFLGSHLAQLLVIPRVWLGDGNATDLLVRLAMMFLSSQRMKMEASVGLTELEPSVQP